MNNGKIKDRSGQVFGSWKILEFKEKDPKKGTLWLCECKCGFQKIGILNNIICGESTQCVNCQTRAKTIYKYEHELPTAIWTKMLIQARRREIEFLVTKEEAYQIYLDQNRKCNLTGLDIYFAKCPKDYRDLKQTASLDRIDSNLEYVLGNVQWIHKKVNLMKNILEEKDFINMCKLVANYKK